MSFVLSFVSSCALSFADAMSTPRSTGVVTPFAMRPVFTFRFENRYCEPVVWSTYTHVAIRYRNVTDINFERSGRVCLRFFLFGSCKVFKVVPARFVAHDRRAQPLDLDCVDDHFFRDQRYQLDCDRRGCDTGELTVALAFR